MKGDDLLIPGTEIKELHYDGFLDWFVSITDPRIHWKYEPTYVIAQVVFILGAILTLIHALIRGGRLPWLWLGTILYGTMVECLCFFIPDVDNYWQSQTFIIFLDRKLPLHIMLIYPCFIYNASVAVAKLNLPKWSEPFAVGLGTVLVDFPYDIVCLKFLHWFWHDTDPNLFDRFYWVPWNSFYFHATFSAGFTFWFHFLRRLFTESEGKWYKAQRYSFLSELLTTVFAAALGPLTGIIVFISIYHPLHDIYKIHSEVTFFIIFATFILFIWTGDRTSRSSYTNVARQTHWSTFLLILHLIIHYGSFLSMTIFFNPEDEIATGLKQQIGPCDEYMDIQTPSGTILSRKKYLCATDYDEQYFDWHCLPNGKPPSDGSVWYTACGVPFENRAEYIVIVSLISLVAATIFTNSHFRSYGDGIFNVKYSDCKNLTKTKKKIS